MGLYLAIFQIELFTAFLWLIECSVLFVFLLLLFYFNVKGEYSYTQDQIYKNIVFIILFLFFFLKNFLTVFNNFFIFDISFFGIIDNYYECISNLITNDLFGFSISYFLINGIEFTFIGFLLLLGSVICVNLFQLNKNVGVNNYTNFLTIFNFFLDFSNFLFLRKQNLLKQGNIKSSIKIFKKK